MFSFILLIGQKNEPRKSQPDFAHYESYPASQLGVLWNSSCTAGCQFQLPLTARLGFMTLARNGGN